MEKRKINRFCEVAALVLALFALLKRHARLGWALAALWGAAAAILAVGFGTKQVYDAAIVQEAARRSIPLCAVSDFAAVAGGGVQAVLDGKTLYAGNDRYMTLIGAGTSALADAAAQLAAQGKTPLYFAEEHRLLGVIAVVMFMVIPELAETLISLANRIPSFFGQIQHWINDLVVRYPELTEWVGQLEIDWNAIAVKLTEFLQDSAGNMLNSTVSAASSATGRSLVPAAAITTGPLPSGSGRPPTRPMRGSSW